MSCARICDLPISFLPLILGKSDPYLKVTFGKKTLPEKARDLYISDTSKPSFYTAFEFVTEMPGAPDLKVGVYDYDAHGEDDLIGSTNIDLVDRWYSPLWQNLGKDYQEAAGYKYRKASGVQLHINEKVKYKVQRNNSVVTLTKVHKNKCCDVTFDDGEKKQGVPLTDVHPYIYQGLPIAPLKEEARAKYKVRQNNVLVIIKEVYEGGRYDIVFSNGEKKCKVFSDDLYVRRGPSVERRKPLERRDLRSPTSETTQGTLRMWVDILPSKLASQIDAYNIELPAQKEWEIRLIIWFVKTQLFCSYCIFLILIFVFFLSRETRHIELPDYDGSDMIDMFCKARLSGGDNWQSTDTHLRAKKGKGSFNYRMKFPIKLPRKPSEIDGWGSIFLQVFDRDIFSSNDLLFQREINISHALDAAAELYIKGKGDNWTQFPFKITRWKNDEEIQEDNWDEMFEKYQKYKEGSTINNILTKPDEAINKCCCFPKKKKSTRKKRSRCCGSVDEDIEKLMVRPEGDDQHGGQGFLYSEGSDNSDQFNDFFPFPKGNQNFNIGFDKVRKWAKAQRASFDSLPKQRQQMLEMIGFLDNEEYEAPRADENTKLVRKQPQASKVSSKPKRKKDSEEVRTLFTFGCRRN